MQIIKSGLANAGALMDAADADVPLDALCREILSGAVTPDGDATFAWLVEELAETAADPAAGPDEREHCLTALRDLAGLLRDGGAPEPAPAGDEQGISAVPG